MFRGQFEHAIDDKGRLSIPAKFREVLREEKTLVLTSADAYLTAYPLTEWRALEERLRANPKFKREQRDFLRLEREDGVVAGDDRGRRGPRRCRHARAGHRSRHASSCRSGPGNRPT